MPVARTIIGSLLHPSSLLWKARAKESNRLTQTVASLHTIDVPNSDDVTLLGKKYNTCILKERYHLPRCKVSITRCAAGIRLVIVLLNAQSSPITSGSCFLVFASSSSWSYGRKLKCSVGMFQTLVASFSKVVSSLKRIETGASVNRNLGMLR